MKAIIVDDERRTRKFLGMAIDWRSLGITEVLEAADGDEAYRLIVEKRPTIILTDMRMPNKDGVDLLRLLRELPYPHKTIVISGYEDYAFLKKTIEYGGFDYFIKPIDESEVYDRLKDALRELKQENDKAVALLGNARAINERRLMLRDSLLTQIADRSAAIPAGEAEELLGDEWRLWQGRPYTLCMCRIQERAGRIERAFSDRKDLLYFSIMNVAGELLDFPRRGTAFRYQSEEGVIVLLLFDLSDAKGVCGELTRTMLRTFGIRIEIALSSRRVFPDEMARAFEEAEAVRQSVNHLRPEPDGVYAEASEPAGMLSLLQEERELRMILFGRSRSDIRRFLSGLLSGCAQAGFLTTRQILWWEQELKWLKELYAGAGRPEEGLGAADDRSLVYWDDTGAFALERLAESLENRLLRLAEEIGRLQGRERKETIYEVRDYLKRHYHEPLMIKDVSAQFFMNSEYVARLFKQEFGIGIKEFVTELRMNHARLLLGNPYLKVGEIADQVGFADEKYFSKVFKKETGLTPQQFRRSDKGSPDEE
ncbi:AraC family transcriptional regulator [Cohnella hongkongensis]|uniref:AraC family transcriptional regulator n=1 Tax=Cohnella hongkongensis TaxID=178337 RepID=A0ABV9F7A1_9BACL